MTAVTTVHHLDRLKALYTVGLLDSFVDQALSKIVERQIVRDENDLTAINAQLAQFEEQFGLASEEFWPQYQAGQLADTADFMEWNILCRMRQRIQSRLKIHS
jgi:hypothetical protein